MYITPEYGKRSFTCPHCGVLAQQISGELYYLTHIKAASVKTIYNSTKCYACNDYTIWKYKETIETFDGFTRVEKEIFDIIYPVKKYEVKAHDDMPPEILSIYEEAANVYSYSPRSSAALLRLALQKMMPLLGEKGENINEDIAGLVKKGLPIEIQQAADVLRVVGNNAVHPGQIDVDAAEI